MNVTTIYALSCGYIGIPWLISQVGSVRLRIAFYLREPHHATVDDCVVINGLSIFATNE